MAETFLPKLDLGGLVPMPLPMAPAQVTPTPAIPHGLDVSGPNEQVADAYSLKPHHAALFDRIAQANRQKSGLESYAQAADQGMTPEQLDEDRQRQAMEQRLAQLSQKVAAETVHLDDSQFNEIQKHLTDTIANPVPLPHEAPLQTPNVWQGLAGLAGAALNPEFAFSAGATPFTAQLDQQAKDTARNYQDYAIADRSRTQQIQGLNMLADNQAAHDQRLLAFHQHNASLYQSEATRIQGQLWQMDAKKRDRVVRLFQQYDSANTPGEKGFIASRIAAEDKASAPSKDMLEADVKALGMRNEHLASQDWESALHGELAQFGVISPERQADFEAQRQSIARHYGLVDEKGNVDATALRPVPTEETLAKQNAKTKKAEFDQRFNALQDHRRAQIAQSQGRLDVARGQLNLAGQRYQLAQSLGYGNMELARFRAEMEKYNALAKEDKKTGDAAIKDLDPLVAKAKASFDSLNGPKSGATRPQIAAAKAKYDALVGQQLDLKLMQQPVIQLPEFFGGGTVENPGYRPPHPQGDPPNVPSARLSPIDKLNRDKQQALSQGRDPKQVETIYQRELKKLRGG